MMNNYSLNSFKNSLNRFINMNNHSGKQIFEHQKWRFPDFLFYFLEDMSDELIVLSGALKKKNRIEKSILSLY